MIDNNWRKIGKIKDLQNESEKKYFTGQSEKIVNLKGKSVIYMFLPRKIHKQQREKKYM